MTVAVKPLDLLRTSTRERERKEQSYAQCLRFFEGLGKALSSWEMDFLAKAERRGNGEATEV